MKLRTELSKDTELQLKRCVFVGRLTTEDELANTLIEAPVTFQDEENEYILFNLTCLNDIPEQLSRHFIYSNRIFRGSTKSYNNVQKIRSKLIPNYDRLLPIQRKEMLKERLKNKLILFSLSSNNMFLMLDILRIEDITPASRYTLIPQPHLSLQESRASLENRLINGSPIQLLHHPNILMTPHWIYYDHYLYSNLLWTKHPTVSTTYYVHAPEKIIRMPVTDTFFEGVAARYDDHMLVMNEAAMEAIEQRVSIDGQYLRVAMIADRNSEIAVGNGGHEALVLSHVTSLSAAVVESRQPSTAQPTLASSLPELATNGTEAYQDGLPSSDPEELRFLERLRDRAHTKGLYYDSQDLCNFHISAKTNMLTIIGGMSGTGKSQLARLYGEALGLTYGTNLLLVPISPAHHEPNDILGFYNPVTNEYHESETGLVSLLMHAQQYPEQLHMVIFDEMNLSQVEHWFSPFISILEVEASQRTLRLYRKVEEQVETKAEEQHGSNPHAHLLRQPPPELRIGDNVIFVGTVNFDETTKTFSSRLLDRANVIFPRKLTFREVQQLHRSGYKSQAAGNEQPITGYAYRHEWNAPAGRELEWLTQAEIDLLDQLHHVLQVSDRQLGISFRVARGIARYVRNIPRSAEREQLILRSVAFDIQLKQRVLTKITGTETAVGELIGYVNNTEYEPGRVAHMLLSESAQRVSSFQHSMEWLKHKAKELMTYGYTT
ncbi:hypothetical protein [Paenibacillus sp. 481]|uniref:hypothetical protein n=1 Tax=Paenibacillus sp. 481 TaxID=2835869 RepID=UPI001E351B7F|nr:hypothetical protein [Paenibacillus sp. 481]UHA72385.1 hypothetical protein KIK04_17110 [Paenibacillus sp. 481]